MRHRNPLFDQRLGLSPLSLTIDMLYCWYLGVFRICCAVCMWHFLEEGIWASSSNMDEQIQNSLIVTMSSLRGVLHAESSGQPR